MIIMSTYPINRIWAMPNKWTFEIAPIKQLLNRYVGDGKGWVDPFAGFNSPAEYTNDLNPKANAKSHIEAIDFAKSIQITNLKGVIFDPPYSLEQIKRSYDSLQIELPYWQTLTQFSNVKDVLASKIELNGYAICCGWNSNGFGKTRGFEIIEILLVAHGGHHLDTIVTVERKVR
jgi:hypothetical protein